MKTASKRAIQKTEATGDLIGNKIANKITSVSTNIQRNLIQRNCISRRKTTNY